MLTPRPNFSPPDMSTLSLRSEQGRVLLRGGVQLDQGPCTLGDTLGRSILFPLDPASSVMNTRVQVERKP